MELEQNRTAAFERGLDGPNPGSGHSAPGVHAEGRGWRRHSVSGLLLELVMIMIGVFLGATAEQLRESRHEHTLAVASLQNFRREVNDNQQRILRVQSHHDSLRLAMGQLLADRFRGSSRPPSLSDIRTRARFRGIEPVDFDHTAWDLALATQVLTEIDPRLAYTISRVYTQQQAFQHFEDSFSASAFTPSSFANFTDASGLVLAMSSYLGDVHEREREQLAMYHVLLPQLDSALGTTARAEFSRPSTALIR